MSYHLGIIVLNHISKNVYVREIREDYNCIISSSTERTPFIEQTRRNHRFIDSLASPTR